MSASAYFKDKKITVMGLGLLGRGVGDVAYLAEAGAAEVVVTDLKNSTELADSVTKLSQYKDLHFVLGEHRPEDFRDRDLILVAAGVPLDSPFLAIAREAGVPLKQSASLFAELAQIPIIGVTGTRGKSTVTHMIHHVLSVVTGEEVLLGGNVRGISNLQLLNQVQADSLCVMELDSWQLQGWGWSKISPQVAVFTNFMDDHLNYYSQGGKSYEEAMEQYFLDKAQIFLHQAEGGVFITTPEVFTRAQKLAGSLGQEVVLVDDSTLPEDVLLAMPGQHNRLNAALAVAALRATGLTDEDIFTALASFSGVSGRLELVHTTDNGVRIYNDNNATTPQATVAALQALSADQPKIILIAGGADKNIDLNTLAYEITKHCKQVFLTPGSGTDKLLELIHNSTTAVTVLENLASAFTEARLAASSGDIILFSPAFASFAQYKNEYERNDEFMNLVQSVQD